ncbi:MAG TPA: HupE/UreJ family protein [Gammaproteobacteria bacterium]
MHNTTTKLLVAFILLATSGSALAHPGHDIAGFTAGALHPFNGFDHLLAMLTVGLWAATLGGSAMWKVPVAFVSMLAIGAVLAMSGIQMPLVEPLIALSVLLLGVVVALALRVSAIAGIAMAGLFALFHGHAHGSELPVTASSYVYLFGMTLASSALHLSGFAIGRALMHYTWLLRSSGAAIAITGMWLIAGV